MPRFALKRAKKRSVITLADRARDAGQWELAAGFYREALHRKPENPPIWVQYGHVLKEAGHLVKAETAYRRAIAYNEHDADSYLQLGHVLKIQGKQEEARAAYLRAFALDPSLDDAVFELAPFGWPKAHLSALQGMFGRDVTDAQTSSNVTGTSLDRLAPVVAPLAQTWKRARSFRFVTARGARRRPPDEDIALIAPYFESDGVAAQTGDSRFEIFSAVEYLSNPALWSSSPHYLFDPGWYAGQLAVPLDPALNPFIHYLRVGVYEGMSPHPLFDPEFYLAQWAEHEPDGFVEQVLITICVVGGSTISHPVAYSQQYTIENYIWTVPTRTLIR